MDKSKRISLMIAGGISLLFFLFHSLLFQLFDWKNTLTCLDQANWAIFQTFNLVSILMVGMIAYFSFRHPADLTKTSLGKSLSFAFGLFYLIRIVSEFIFFGYRGGGSLIIIVLCLVPALVYLWISFSNLSTKKTVTE